MWGPRLTGFETHDEQVSPTRRTIFIGVTTFKPPVWVDMLQAARKSIVTETHSLFEAMSAS
jgi:hypothetical protein